MAITAEVVKVNKHGNTPTIPEPLHPGSNIIQTGAGGFELSLFSNTGMLVVNSGIGISMTVVEDPDREVYHFTDEQADSLTVYPGEIAEITYKPPGYHSIERTFLAIISQAASAN